MNVAYTDRLTLKQDIQEKLFRFRIYKFKCKLPSKWQHIDIIEANPCSVKPNIFEISVGSEMFSQLNKSESRSSRTHTYNLRIVFLHHINSHVPFNIVKLTIIVQSMKINSDGKTVGSNKLDFARGIKQLWRYQLINQAENWDHTHDSPGLNLNTTWWKWVSSSS